MWKVKSEYNKRGVPSYFVYNTDKKDDREFEFDCEQFAKECASSLNSMESSKSEN